MLDETLKILFPVSESKRKIAIELLKRVKQNTLDVKKESLESFSSELGVNFRVVVEVKHKLTEIGLISKEGNYHTAKLVLGRNKFMEEWNNFLISKVS